MPQSERTPDVHDVVVIGSGAGGGTVVKVLTDLGIKVTLLEAGPMLNPAKDFKEHVWPYQVDHRGAGPHAELYFGKSPWPFGYFEAPNGYWKIEGEPYTVAPDSKFGWFRSRIIGGRTNHYGRISLRFSDYDFKPYSFDGLGTDWPITYDEMSSYYDKAEEFIGVTGTHQGLRTAPDGKFLPPIAPRVHETLVQKACQKLSIPCVPSRMAMLTKPVHGRANESGMVGRNLTDTTGYGVGGYIPALANLPRHNCDGIGGMHVYIPWWLLDDKSKDFPRGYHVEIGGGFGMPGLGSFHGACAHHEGYGNSLKSAIREQYGAYVHFEGRGEMIPNANSYCEIDPSVVDQWGIPVLRFHFRWSEYELNQVRHMDKTFRSLVEALGGKPASRPFPERAVDAISTGGEIIHEARTIRMGEERA